MNTALKSIEKEHENLTNNINTYLVTNNNLEIAKAYYLRGIYHLLYFYIRHLLLKEEKSIN